jgi:aminomethyltransferase
MDNKKTALYNTHVEAGAKMVPFAGYEMPVVYTNISEEHLAVRNQAGLFDVSHMGQFIIRGKEAYDLVQQVSSNDAAVLAPGDVQYSCLPNASGGVVDDLLVYRLFDDQCSEGEQAYMLVVNASNIEKDWEWISAANVYDAKMIDISSKTSLLALQGPNATAILKKLTDEPVESIEYYHFKKGTVAGISNVLISATGYTGAGGYELYFDEGQSEVLWHALLKAGAEHGLIPAGLGARDTLRLEKAFCLYGHELDDNTSPIAAGLSWIVKTKKVEEFFSKSIFAAERKQGTERKLIGFKMEDRRIPRQGYAICDEEGHEIGHVTSGTMSPSLEEPIGVGYINADKVKLGGKIFVGIRDKKYQATQVKLPFL